MVDRKRPGRPSEQSGLEDMKFGEGVPIDNKAEEPDPVGGKVELDGKLTNTDGEAS